MSENGSAKVKGLRVFGNNMMLTQGNSYFVDPTNGSDSNDGKTPATAVKSVIKGETLLTANQNDVLYYLAGSSSDTFTETLTWDKSYTHFIGITAPANVGQRARMFVGTNVFTPMINVTGSGCIFKNLYFFHGVADATALVCGQVTGGRNYFENVHFAGIGTTTQDAAGAASLKLDGAEENLFKGCTIGIDTIGRGSAANSELLIAAANGGNVRNTFEDCTFLTYADANTHQFVISEASSVDRWIKFKNCEFINPIQSAATTMTEALDINGTGSPNGMLLLKNCTMIGATDWEAAAVSGTVYIDGGTPSATVTGLAVAVAAS